MFMLLDMIWSSSIHSMRPLSCAIKDRPFIPVGGSRFSSREKMQNFNPFFFFFFFEGQYFRCSANCKLHSLLFPKKPTFLIIQQNGLGMAHVSYGVWRTLERTQKDLSKAFPFRKYPILSTHTNRIHTQNVASFPRWTKWMFKYIKAVSFDLPPESSKVFGKNSSLTVNSVPSEAWLYHWHMVFRYNNPMILSSNW